MIIRTVRMKAAGRLKKVYAIGCLTERYAGELAREIPEVDGFFGSHQMAEVVRELGARYRTDLLGERVLTTPSHTAYVKIAEGCDRPCAFCAIPLMRGKHVSRPMEEIVAESHVARPRRGQGTRRHRAGYHLLRSGPLRQAAPGGTAGAPGRHPRSRLGTVDVCVSRTIPARMSWRSWRGLRRSASTWISPSNTVPTACSGRCAVVSRRGSCGTSWPVSGTGSPASPFVPRSSWGIPGKGRRSSTTCWNSSRRRGSNGWGCSPIPRKRGPPRSRWAILCRKREKERRRDAVMALQQEISDEANQASIGSRRTVLVERVEGGVAVGRTEFDAPEIDNEVFIRGESLPAVGEFCRVEIVDAYEYDVVGRVIGDH